MATGSSGYRSRFFGLQEIHNRRYDPTPNGNPLEPRIQENAAAHFPRGVMGYAQKDCGTIRELLEPGGPTKGKEYARVTRPLTGDYVGRATQVPPNIRASRSGIF